MTIFLLHLEQRIGNLRAEVNKKANHLLIWYKLKIESP